MKAQQNFTLFTTNSKGGMSQPVMRFLFYITLHLIHVADFLLVAEEKEVCDSRAGIEVFARDTDLNE